MIWDIYRRDGTLVVERVRVADTFLKRLGGLMFQKSPAGYNGLIFYRARGIHTCFMRFKLDVIFVDREFKVLKVRRALAPFKSVFCPGAYAAIEWQAGKGGTVEEGDFLELKDG